ncbi:CobW family GTP-binding protein [Oribacterium sp. WCC10]|uniref:CobW family GTP-binding protein n=1 Tax=Oribacterium sp. WCC10 TaxID=1855343 RepID=UPI0008F4204C|nr:CobW family GTP-binding protein [Oribacterium sp. WCC10]SFG56366.1 Cobalamin synthesis protein cobW C-terminal domain-containing protein [Oribacterium sp. WCC10]
MTSIDIVSGFLGAGKTTFIQRLLDEALKTEKVVLIENEFGEIGIDSGFLKDSGIQIREMNQGCICCSLVGNFEQSLTEVVNTYKPDRIIIEPSGVGKLSDIIGAVKSVSENLEVELHAAVTVVDAKKAKMYSKNFGEFFNNQIEYAGTVVLSRTDIADDAKIGEAVSIIKGINERATVITTPEAELTGEQLVNIISKKYDLAEEMLEDVMERVHEHEGHEHEDEHDEVETLPNGVQIHHSHSHHHHHHDHEHEHEHHHHDEDEHEHHHHHEDGEECCCHHHDEDEHEHHHHHEDGEECCCHHHDEDEHEHHHHHDHDDECCSHHHDEDEHDHHHHEHDHEHHHDGCCCGHDHDADEVFKTWGVETPYAFEKDKLSQILEEMAHSEKFGKVVRCKGMLPTKETGEWMYFDLVPEQTEIRSGSPDYTGKVVVIGADLNESALREAFAGM